MNQSLIYFKASFIIFFTFFNCASGAEKGIREVAVDKDQYNITTSDESKNICIYLENMSEFSVGIRLLFEGLMGKEYSLTVHDYFYKEDRYKNTLSQAIREIKGLVGTDTINRAKLHVAFICTHQDLVRKNDIIERLCREPIKAFSLALDDIDITYYSQPDIDLLKEMDKQPFEYLL